MKQVLLEVFKLIFPEKFCFPFQIHSLWFFCPDLQPIQSLFFPNASTACFLVAFLFVIYFSYSTKLYKLNWTDTKLGGLIESLSFCLHNWSSHSVPQGQCEVGVQIPYAFTELKHGQHLLYQQSDMSTVWLIATYGIWQTLFCQRFFRSSRKQTVQLDSLAPQIWETTRENGRAWLTSRKDTLLLPPVSLTSKNLLPQKQRSFLVPISAKWL